MAIGQSGVREPIRLSLAFQLLRSHILPRQTSFIGRNAPLLFVALLKSTK
jgi:hypothetical protein